MSNPPENTASGENSATAEAGPDGASGPPPWLALAYALTVFGSAFLLFQVQPLISRAILPWFGGTPGVWTVCMLFFQTLLFGGYAYSHLVTVRLSSRARTAVHLVLLVVACVMLPILPGADWKPTGEEDPTGWIVLVLLASVGLPFFVLATTGPLLQAWFASTHPNRSPYRLYALSNIGSLLALLSYPFVVEPMMGLVQQSTAWSVGFGVFALLCATCGITVATVAGGGASTSEAASETASAETPAASTGGSPTPDAPPTRGTMLLWFVLAMVPSVMLLATTNQVCLDVASIPFLWVLPLSLYLLSFILCFDSDRWYSRAVFSVAVLLTSGGMIAALAAGSSMDIQLQVIVFFAGLFSCAMYCHGELAAARPHPRHLTTFYLIMSAGGAAGGLFTGIVAPIVFNAYFELHLAIFALVLLVFGLEFIAASGAGDAQEAGDGESGDGGGRARWSRPVLLAVVVVIVVGLGNDIRSSGEDVIYADRNFYGVLRVKEYGEGQSWKNRRLVHGRILHGKQYLLERRNWPTTYYGHSSGVGLALDNHGLDRPRTIGVVGLGTGTIATYVDEDDELVFYEINQNVVDIAREWFTYLSDCKGEVSVQLGDARLVLEREDPRGFDVLALDAFSSDAIPTHLLTREAMEIYLKHLAPDGILAVHVSNKHFDLEPVLESHAKTFGLVAARQNDLLSDEEEDATGCSSSTWILLTREAAALQEGELVEVPPLDWDSEVDWTDDETNVTAVLHDLDWSDLLQNPFD